VNSRFMKASYATRANVTARFSKRRIVESLA